MKDSAALAVPSTLLLLASLAWTVVAVGGDTRLEGVTLVLVVAPVWVATVAAIAGMLVARSRWARRLAVAVGVSHAALALSMGQGPLWWAGVATSAAAMVSVAGPWLNGIVRGLPSASGPPPRAVLVPLALVGVPFVVGMADPPPVAAAVAGFTALVAAFWYIRALPGAVVAVRVLWPATALVTAWPMGLPGGVVTALCAAGVAALAWDGSVSRAVHPLERPGTVVPIPPELVPKEILDAAGLDDRGRRR